MQASFVRFEHNGKIAAKPGNASTRISAERPSGPSDVELERIPYGDVSGYIGPARPAPALDWPIDPGKAKADPEIPTRHARTPSEVEMSCPPSPQTLNAAPAYQTWNNPTINKWRLLTSCLVFMANGMNDSAPGALLPYIEDYYRVNYAVVSTIFIANALGFIFAAFWVHALDLKIGRARTLMFAEACVAVGYTMMCIPPPFPVFVIGFFVSGFGIAVGLALNNVFAANTEPSSTVLGVVHGSYGIGGLIAPIISTAAVTNGVNFSRIYIILLGIRILNFFLSGWSFWNFERDNAIHAGALLHDLQSTNLPESARSEASKVHELGQALKTKATLVGALFIFAYQGAEVSISGWVISFLINYRNGNPAQVGYVTAGFWGGITLGRFCLMPFALRIGERLFVVILIGLTVVFQLLLWLVPNVIANSVATAILGLLLGPIYPCATRVFSKLLDRRLQSSSLAFVSSAGSSGGAVAPFMTGVIAQQKGTWVLSPICIGLYVGMLGCWGTLTWGYNRKRHE